MTTAPAERKKPFYANLWIQVLIAIAVAVVFGYLNPAKAMAMKPLGDGFIRLITMVISLIIFCTVVSGIASMQDMKRWAASAARRCCILKLSPLSR
jgi:aerobic C4-dicarboxylate transport protein